MGNLIEWGAIVGATAVDHFGDPRREFEAARTAVAVSPASRYTLLLFRGADAKEFLQGQVTCDLDQVTADRAQFGGYCTPKGRLLANFLLLSTNQGYLMYLPADIASNVAARLKKFILRSKVTIEEASGWRALGVIGPGAPDLLRQALQLSAAEPLNVAMRANVSVVQLRGEALLVVAPIAEMDATWQRLAQQAVPVGEDCWSWAQIHAGMPWITAATQDGFIPQMIGLDAIGGISFEKGCYTGQEIVARAHYLGEVKRALRSGRTDGLASPGDALTSGGQARGTVLNAVPVPGEGCELLAVVSVQNEESGNLTLPGGEAVTLSPAQAA
ncbi:MAG: folate-binding protein [Betaproteobacteria bacterium]